VLGVRTFPSAGEQASVRATHTEVGTFFWDDYCKTTESIEGTEKNQDIEHEYPRMARAIRVGDFNWPDG